MESDSRGLDREIRRKRLEAKALTEEAVRLLEAAGHGEVVAELRKAAQLREEAAVLWDEGIDLLRKGSA